MKKILILLLMATCIHQAEAADVTINWAAPLKNTDNSVPVLFEGFNLYRVSSLPIVTGKVPGPLVGSSANPLTPTTLAYTDKNVAPGTYYYGITAWHCDATGCTESVPTVTNAVIIKVVPKTPTAPGSITITVNGVQSP